MQKVHKWQCILKNYISCIFWGQKGLVLDQGGFPTILWKAKSNTIIHIVLLFVDHTKLVILGMRRNCENTLRELVNHQQLWSQSVFFWHVYHNLLLFSKFDFDSRLDFCDHNLFLYSKLYYIICSWKLSSLLGVLNRRGVWVGGVRCLGQSPKSNYFPFQKMISTAIIMMTMTMHRWHDEVTCIGWNSYLNLNTIIICPWKISDIMMRMTMTTHR